MPVQKNISVGIIGATGLSGLELARIIDAHPYFELKRLASSSAMGKKLSSFYPEIAGERFDLELIDIDELLKSDIELVFLAVPHTKSAALVPSALEKGLRLIDLAADFRLKESVLYEKHYGFSHPHPELLSQAVYGLPELYRDKIKDAQLIANPGCYPTACSLAALPLLSSDMNFESPLIIDAKSGYSGAGRASLDEAFQDKINENFYSYKAFKHQHSPEISQVYAEVSGHVQGLSFVPHLLPIERGILASLYVKLSDKDQSLEPISELYKNYYSDAHFVQVLEPGQMPELKTVAHTNSALIGLALDEKQGLLSVACAIDNLGKGASSQAVQNANIMFGFPEEAGLIKHKADI